MGGFSLWHWLIVLVIVVLVFGTKRLKNVGQDLGEAVKGFKKGVHGDDQADDGRTDGKPAAQLPDESRPVEPGATRPEGVVAPGDRTPRGDDRTPR